MAMTVPFTGGCACGAIRYECTAAPLMALNCHCRDCQLASGSAFASVFVVATDSFHMLGSEPKFFEKLSDAGNTMLRGFCNDCGSPVFIREPGRPKILVVHAATLDDPSVHNPVMDIFTRSAHPWDAMRADTEKFDQEPPVPDEFGR